MKARHTTGPWRLTWDTANLKPEDHYAIIMAGSGGHALEVELAKRRGSQPENSGFDLTGFVHPADANLIVAAPDLLEALQAICDSGCMLADELTDKMLAALRKAEGGAA